MSRLARRGFVAGVGAAGLTAVGALFGKQTAQAAGSCGCCDLSYCPPNMSIGSCESSVNNYVWECTYGGGVYCNCCELMNHNGINIRSAYSCQY